MRLIEELARRAVLDHKIIEVRSGSGLRPNANLSDAGEGRILDLRSLAISPVALIGGILWSIRPTLPFALASAFGPAGAAVFVLTVRSEDAA